MRLLRYLILTVFCIVAIVALIWCIQPDTPPSASSGQHNRSNSIPVQVAVAHKGSIDITRHELGSVTPLANITVRTQISGQLLEVAFKEGQIVQKGDFLAQIDARPYENTLEQSQGALQRDQALLKEAQLDLARYEKLVAQNSLAKQQLDTQASLVQQYQGNVLSDQGQIDAAKLNITYCHITAPVTGRIGLRQIDQGNYVQSSDANGLVTLTQLEPISVLFTLPEDDLPLVMKRLKEGAELQVTAYDRTQKIKLAVGRLTATDSQIDPTTGTIKLRAQFDNQDALLFPNQFVNVEILIYTLQDVIVVPSSAILRGSPGTYVYLIKEDNSVTVRPVKIGPTQDDQIAILDGLSDGDKIIVDGTDKLREGSKVSVPTDTKPVTNQPLPTEATAPPTAPNTHHHHGD